MQAKIEVVGMEVLKDEDYLVIEPCVSCEKHYVEDIWWEDCCDMKRCIHAKEYKKSKRKIETMACGDD